MSDSPNPAADASVFPSGENARAVINSLAASRVPKFLAVVQIHDANLLRRCQPVIYAARLKSGVAAKPVPGINI